MPGFIGLSENDLRDRVGHHHYVLNRPTEYVELKLAGNMDVTDPARREWHALDIADHTPLAPELFESPRRWLPQRVSRQWRVEPGAGIRKELSLQLVPETKGPRAPLVPPASIGASYVGPVVEGEHCYHWAFANGQQGWTGSGSYTSWSTNRWISSGDYLRIQLTWTNPITITGVSFTYTGAWTNSSHSTAKIVLYDQVSQFAAKTNITYTTEFTGMNRANATLLHIFWDHFPNIWSNTYGVTGVTIRFVATANEWGADNC
jgi:hypothetical protein